MRTSEHGGPGGDEDAAADLPGQPVRQRAVQAVPGDLRMMRTLWPVLLASVVGLLPFTVFSTFLVAIAADAGHGVAAVGGLRGLGGLTALAVGVGFAPVLGRVSRWQAAAGALLLLGVAAVFGVVGGIGPLAVFCAATGAATAVLNPALAVAAADRFGAGPASGRAATLVTATQSLAAVLAAPVVALPSLWWGWQGTLAAVAVLAATLALLLLYDGRAAAASTPADDTGPAGYVASLRAVAQVPGAPVLLGISFLRTSAFMGYLAYLAGLYGDRFGLTSTAFAAVWTVSGASFFAGNLLVGRAVNAAEPKVPPERVLLAGAVVAVDP